MREFSATRPDRQIAAIVLPTYDERENIIRIVDEVLAQQDKVEAWFDLRVVVADSSSQDGTIDLVQQAAVADPRIHLVTIPERGIGLGLRGGIEYAIDVLGADVLIEMDADFQHNPTDIPRLLAKVREGYDIVVASRFAEGSVNKMPWYRLVMSVGANQMIRTMLGLDQIKEITTSFRAFRKEAFLRIDRQSVPWQERSFIAVPVFLVRMIECGAKVVEIPMTMHPRMQGYSKMEYWRYVKDIAAFSIRSRLEESNR